MKFLFVMNPVSGRTSNDKAVELIRTTMLQHNIAYRIFHTTGENDDQQLSKLLVEITPEVVIACGGDGTVQLVSRNIIHKKFSLGILPLGSANGLAKSLNIPVNTEAALELIIQHKASRSLDLIRINDHVCVHLSDIGTNALLIKNYEEAGDKGLIGYAKHLLPSIRSSELMKYTIITPEETFHKEGYMLMLANANQYGTGVKISEGSVSDGKFEIANVGEIDLQSAIKAGLTALNIFVDRDMFSDVISTKKAEIRIDQKAHLQVDGEYLGEFDTIRAEIIPSAFNVITNA